MIALNEQQKREKREKILARDADVYKNLGKLEAWKKDIQMRKEKKETVSCRLSFVDKSYGFCFFRMHELLRNARIV